MMKKIECILMRAGTSRGPFFDLRDLPGDEEDRNEVLLKIMGSPDRKQIDGLGGAASVTSKVMMVQPSEREGIDIDYLFAQVFIESPIVDTKPNCGNMMSGAAPFAIERGWIQTLHPETKVMAYNFNTDSVIETIVQTPKGKINYTEGTLEISGVTGSGAPILMNMFNVAGGATGKLFPTGNRKDIVHGLEVSIVDAGNLMVLIKAESLQLSGLEDHGFFKENMSLMQKIEEVRIEVGRIIGMGDVSNSVIPKVGILSDSAKGGAIRSQYFTPYELHPSHAVTGAVCVSTACKATGTVASDIASVNDGPKETIVIEHPSGILPIRLETSSSGDHFSVKKAGTLRTARKIMDGVVYY